MDMNKHAAVKCTYNNGDEGDYVGFNGTCSEDIIKMNTQSHVWCSQPECPCTVYFENGFEGERPIGPCMESKLFEEWSFGAGYFHNGPKKGQPKRANIEKGGIALLTTRFPGDSEEDRKIIGLYKIGRVRNLENQETKFYADDKYRIRLPLEEAKQLYLWDYYSINSDKPQWGTGLLRYLSDEQVKKVLLDLKQTVQSNEHKEIIEELLIDFSEIEVTENGQRTSSVPRNKRIAIHRKYGAGGEGENHKKLKEWIATHPESIGLKSVKKCEQEYVFLSGDTVDILFELADGTDAVVEIETTIPLPGCHQAIKYRALRCAERRLELDSNKVKAILVAWEIPQDVRQFCNQYGILHYKIKI